MSGRVERSAPVVVAQVVACHGEDNPKRLHRIMELTSRDPQDHPGWEAKPPDEELLPHVQFHGGLWS